MTLIPRSLQARTAIVLALVFFVLLSLFFVTTYFSIRDSLVARSDGEVLSELKRVSSELKFGLSDDALVRILAEHHSIGESPLRFVLFNTQQKRFIELTREQAGTIPIDLRQNIVQHPSQPLTFSTPNGTMRVISTTNKDFIMGAAYNTLLLEEAEDSIIQVFAYYLAAGLLVAMLGGIFLSKYLIGPISSLARAARTILHMPERSPARLPVSKSIVEVADLAQSMNALLDARENALERQRNFAADAAHELRTPLTVLKGEIEVELRMTDSESSQAELLRSNLEEIERLISTVQDLLELAEIEAEGDGDRARSECSMLSAIHYAADRLRPLAESRGISIVIPNHDVTIAAQEKRVTRLVYNLLLNAVQHSGVASIVEVRLFRTNAGCMLEIEDHGKGIPPERLTHLFERFHRMGQSSTNSLDGAGLGLAIVKSITDHYGFSVSVRSSEDAGTTVSLSIPSSSVVG
jgi:signal transduction histidine kinase